MSELTPCPFCGGEASLNQEHKSKRWFIGCEGCEVETPSYREDMKAEAIKAWNQRVRKEGNIRKLIEDTIIDAYNKHKDLDVEGK